MNSEIIRGAGSFLFLVALQVLVLNNIQAGGMINPYIYVLFILMLPLETPKWLILVLGFLLGLSVDIFSQTLGMHTSATLLMAYFRPFVLAAMAPRDNYEFGMRPSLQGMGVTWFLSYAGILVLVHHLCLFFLEVFRLEEFLSTLSRVGLSLVFSLLLILLVQVFTFREKKVV